MALGPTDEQRALAESLDEWARDRRTTDIVKAAEGGGPEAFADTWEALTALGVASIAVPEALGGAGGSLVDLACALEACAAGMVPGPLLSTAVAATVLAERAGDDAVAAVVRGTADGSATVALAPSSSTYVVDATGEVSGEVPVLWDAGATSHLLVGAVVGAADRWFLIATAVGYAKVREQFGRTIGSFQAIKHLCAEMLARSESATAVAWDAAGAHDEAPEQFALAAAVAGSVALDAAVANAQDCIQVLGGIGFTWEHDAHLYLRRAMANRQLLGGSDARRLLLAEAALDGRRRATHVDLEGAGEQTRQAVREEVARIAALPGAERRTALADAGLIAPHYPAPYGRSAGAVDQIVIDDELRAAGIRPPELAIAAWALPTILEHGDDAQRERFAGPTLRGRAVLVPAVQRARRGLRPCVAADEGGARRRRLETDRPEGMDVAGPGGPTGRSAWHGPTRMPRSTRASPTTSSTCAPRESTSGR